MPYQWMFNIKEKNHILLDRILESPYESVLFINTHTHAHAEMESKMQENYLGKNKCLMILITALLNKQYSLFSPKDKSQFHPQ